MKTSIRFDRQRQPSGKREARAQAQFAANARSLSAHSLSAGTPNRRCNQAMDADRIGFSLDFVANAALGHIPIGWNQSDRKEYVQTLESGAISYRPNEVIRSISAPGRAESPATPIERALHPLVSAAPVGVSPQALTVRRQVEAAPAPLERR